MINIRIKKNYINFKLNIDFISQSKRIGILGASGSGKSLTLKSIAGIETPNEGFISVDGIVMFDSKSKVNLKPQKRNTGYLFQNYALFPNMTVEENILAGIKGNNSDKRKYLKELIKKFGLEGVEKQYPNKLSGGQQQRCAIARIMAYNPDIVLLDEPFSALDVYLREKMQREFIEMIKDYKGTVIIVSHNIDEIYRVSDEVIVLDNGKISISGKTKEIFKNPQTIAAARLMGYGNIALAENNNCNMYIPKWDVNFPVNDNVKAVAINAKKFTIEKDDYYFNVIEPVITEDLFEYNISFKPSYKSVDRVNWKISKNYFVPSMMPEKIYLNKKDLVYLYS